MNTIPENSLTGAELTLRQVAHHEQKVLQFARDSARRSIGMAHVTVEVRAALTKFVHSPIYARDRRSRELVAKIVAATTMKDFARLVADLQFHVAQFAGAGGGVPAAAPRSAQAPRAGSSPLNSPTGRRSRIHL